MSTSLFSLEILAAEKSVFSGESETVRFPAVDGSYGVLAHHESAIVAVVPGELSFKDADGHNHIYVVSSGLVKIENNSVLVLVETAETPEEIDIKRAERAAADAKEAILLKESKRERKSAQFKLARAISRLRAKEHSENF